MEEDRVVSGRLDYKNIEFAFLFDGEELRLIPPKDKVEKIRYEWFMKSLGNGIYTASEAPVMEEMYLTGCCNENGQRYIFYTQKGGFLHYQNSVLIIGIIGYIKCNRCLDKICKISFSSPEINCIHPVNQGIEYTYDHKKLSETGVFTLTTADFDSTTTEEREFVVDGKSVEVSFGISRGFSTDINTPPITMNSVMNFRFEPTEDYEFILRLWKIAREFIRFLCYRKNVTWFKSEISVPYEDNKTLKVGEFFLVGHQQENELETLKQGRYITQVYIDGFEGEMLSDLAEGLLYTRHLPVSYEAGRHIDASRFIMITAAFEWEFRRKYPQGIPKKEATIKIEKNAEEALQTLIDGSSGKLKNKYKFLKRLIKSDSLQTEVLKMGEDYDSIIGDFGRHLYELNGETLVYSEMGKRISDQRNHFAHGDLDKEFIGSSLLDLVFMEYVVYTLQLKYYGVSELNIKKAINDLFHLNFKV